MTTTEHSAAQGADRETVWLTAAALLTVWLVLALLAIAAPWFVIFAAFLWLGLPLVVIAVAGLVSAAVKPRRQARSIVRGAWYALGIEVLPSIVVILIAVSRMTSDNF